MPLFILSARVHEVWWKWGAVYWHSYGRKVSGQSPGWETPTSESVCARVIHPEGKYLSISTRKQTVACQQE